MGVAIYGNYGWPILAFPTSMGDEWEQEGQSMIRTLSPYVDQGRIRIFCINGVQSDSFANKLLALARQDRLLRLGWRTQE